MASKFRLIDNDLYEYILNSSLREPELLKRLRMETQKLPRAVMQISPLQGQFMMMLSKLMGIKKALEIGVFTGYSSLCLAMSMPEKGKLFACDISEEWTTIAERYWKEAGVDHMIELRLAPAVRTLDLLRQNGHEGTFDFVFIDADKDNYEVYYEKSLALLRSGGLIMVDNVLWKGYVFDKNNNDTETFYIRQFNQCRKTDLRVDISMLPLGDGVTLIRKL